MLNFLKTAPLLAVVAVPMESPDSFVDLKYKNIKPNEVELTQTVSIAVNESASPLFYKFNEVKKWSQVKVKGKVTVEKSLGSEKNDAYFQVGVIYEGNYRPGWVVRRILPEWLMTIINLNSNYGLDSVDFHHFSKESGFEARSESMRSIKLNFISLGSIGENGSFEGVVNLKDKKVLGLWLRADGDDHKGIFTTEISELEIVP